MAPNYGLGKIYVIRNTVNAKLYVGSTVRTLAQRMVEHRSKVKIAPTLNMPLYTAIREIGVQHFYIELIKDFPCERREQLHTEEGKHIREMNTMSPNGYNLIIAGRSREGWHQDNAERWKNYLVENHEVIKDGKHDYYMANKDAIRARNRNYYLTHKDANRERDNARGRERYAAKRAPAANAVPEAA